MHPNSKLIFERHLAGLFRPHATVLEVGPDAFPSTYQASVADPTISWETLDVTPRAGLTYVAESEYRFPIPDGRFDVVFSAQVIEHVRKIWVWIKELARVCKSGGRVVTISPVSWPYHEAPVDCWRIYPEGMRALYDEADLEVELSTCETLELPKGYRQLPGASSEPGARRFVKRLLGWPVTCAVDTVTVGVKV